VVADTMALGVLQDSELVGVARGGMTKRCPQGPALLSNSCLLAFASIASLSVFPGRTLCRRGLGNSCIATSVSTIALILSSGLMGIKEQHSHSFMHTLRVGP